MLGEARARALGREAGPGLWGGRLGLGQGHRAGYLVSI